MLCKVMFSLNTEFSYNIVTDTTLLYLFYYYYIFSDLDFSCEKTNK